MSTQVDERVVSMRFDNKQFESNVSTTMSTLDKLKQKLHLKDASKGLENVGTAAKNVNMNGLSSAVDTVRVKFSALDVIGVTALTNITNQAVNAGKRMISALTIDPVKTGLQEYETQINAVQTILANTESKGTTLDQVNQALEELNKYADMTIYNFTEMTRNIGTFTAAGVDLDTSVTAIQGIANLAAVSGSTSQQASTAMYQLSQALSSGTVKLMDWNSVVNAGMGGQVFQDALKETARNHGILIDDMIDHFGSFRESLSTGWLSADILTETLSHFTMAAEEGTKQWEEYKKSLMDDGYTEEQAEAILKLSNTATDAATKVKTFTQLWDVLKEAAQSGWSQTWKLIIGDFEEAKNLFTPLSDFLTGVINGMSDARNRMLQIALDFSAPWKAVMDKLNGAGLGNVKKVISSVGDLADKLEYYQDVVNKVWRGDYNNRGDNPDRYDLLTKDGYNPRIVQDLVNKGYKYKLTVEDIEASHKKFGVAVESSNEKIEETSDAIAKLTDEQLRDAGLKEEEIRLYRALAKESDRLGISMEELADRMSKNNGRDLLIDSFKNFGNIITGTAKAIKDAYVAIFDPPGVEELGIRLYGIITSLNEFSEKIRLTDKETGELNETGQKIERTFKGIFAIIDIVTTILGGPLKLAFKVVSKILGHFGIGLLDVTAWLGDMAVKLRDSIDGLFDFSGITDRISPLLEKAGENFKALRDWIVGIKDAEDIPKYIAEGLMNGLGRIASFFRTWFKTVGDSLTSGLSGVPSDMISGFCNGIWNGMKIAGQTIMEFATMLIDKVEEVLGIQSPSKVFFAIGGFIIAGLISGLSAAFPGVRQFFENMSNVIADGLSGIDFGKIAAIITSLSMGIGVYKIGGFLNNVGNMLGGLGDVFEGVGDILSKSAKGIKKILNSTNKVIKSFAGVLNGIKWVLAGEALKSFAIAILILAGALAVLTLLDPIKLTVATTCIASLMIGMVALLKGITEMGDGAEKKLLSFAGVMLGMSATILLLTIAMKRIAAMPEGDLLKSGVVIVGLAVIFGLLIKFASAVSKDMKQVAGIAKLGTTLMKVAGAMLIMVFVAKLIASMDLTEMAKAAIGIVFLSAIIKGLTKVSGKAGANVDKVGPTILKVAGAMLLLVIAAKIIGGMEWSEMGKAAVGITFLGAIVAGLIWATKLAGDKIDRVGKTILSVGAAMLLLAITAKIIATMDWTAMGKAAVGITFLGAIVAGLIWATKLAGSGKKMGNVAKTILMASVSVGILAGVAVLLSLMDLASLAKGVGAVTILGAIVTGMIWATRGANNCMKNLIVMTVAIAVMAGAAAALTFLDPAKLAIASGALSLLMGMFAAMIKATSGIAKSNKDTIKTLVMLTATVAILGGLLYLLNLLPMDGVMEKAAALSMVMLAMTGALVAISTISKIMGGIQFGPLAKGIGGLALMGGVLLLFAYIFSVIGGMGDNVMKAKDVIPLIIGTMLAMSVLLLALIGIGAIIGATAGVGFLGLVGLLAMGLMMGAFGEVCAYIGKLAPDIMAAKDSIKLIVEVMAAMTLMLIPLSIIGILAPLGITAIGGMGLVMLEFAAVFWLIGAMSEGINKASAIIPLITNVMTIMTDLLVKIAPLAPLAVVGVAAIGALTLLIGAVGVFATAIGGVVDNLEFLEDFLDVGLKILIKLAGGIGEMIGAFVAGMATQIMTILPSLGENLSKFMENAKPFLDGVSALDEKTAIGAAILVSTIGALLGASFISGIANFLGCGILDLASDLCLFWMLVKPFLDGVATIDSSVIENVKTLAEAMIIMTGANLLDGLTKLINFGQGSPIAKFGSELAKLGPHLKTFANDVSGMNKSTLTCMQVSAEAAKLLSETMANLPSTGGWWQAIVGEKDGTSFGEGVKEIGAGIKSYSEAVAGLDVDAIEASRPAVTALTEMLGSIPTSGGMWQAIAGEHSWTTLGSNLVTFGINLMAYGRSVNGIDSYTQSIENSVTAATKLAELQGKIPTSGGLLSSLFGKHDFETFGTNIENFGDALMTYGSKVSGIGDYNDAITMSTTAADGLVEVAKKAKDVGKWDWGKSEIEKFGTNMCSFADSMVTYGSTVSTIGLDAISRSTAEFEKLMSLAYVASMSNFSGMKNFGTVIENLGNSGVEKFCKAFSGAYDQVEEVARTFIGRFIHGLMNPATPFAEAATTITDSVLTEIKKAYESFFEAGRYMTSGFINGVKFYKRLAEIAGREIAAAAAEGAKEELDEHSPSKVGYQIGDFFGVAFVDAIRDYADRSYKAGSEVAGSAREGLSDAVSAIGNLLDGDMDIQPTIRPVVDLTDVRYGAGAISKLLGIGSSVDVATNVNAINSMVNRRNQNGINSDVVAAINKLDRHMGNLGNTTYNTIEGITYDDGSNVAAAIETLVRAAKIGGRA